jgi:hypothetical protein
MVCLLSPCRRVVHQLLTDWHYVEPTKPFNSLLPVRSTCRAWRAVVDADIHHVAVTVPSVAPEYLGTHFPHATSLDLSRYQRSCSEVFPVMQQLNLRCVSAAEWIAPQTDHCYLVGELSCVNMLGSIPGIHAVCVAV